MSAYAPALLLTGLWLAALFFGQIMVSRKFGRLWFATPLILGLWYWAYIDDCARAAVCL